MSGTSLLKRMLDAGMQFTEMSQEQAEKLVKEFVKAGQARRKDSSELVQQLVDRGRTATEQWVSAAQSEIGKQLNRFAGRLDEVESRVEELAAGLRRLEIEMGVDAGGQNDRKFQLVLTGHPQEITDSSKVAQRLSAGISSISDQTS